MKILDISPEISEDLAVWPGDQKYKRQVTMDCSQGDNIGLSTVTSTLHLGAHADGPNHYGAGQEGIASCSLHNYLGPAQVISVNKKPGERILWIDMDTVEIKAPRVLFKTLSFPNPKQWNNDFCSLSAELVDGLAQKGVLLVGIDTPSIDLFDDKKLESHQRILHHKMKILEGLVLQEAEDGLYNLVALPLKIKGGDASPVRAVLLPKEILTL